MYFCSVDNKDKQSPQTPKLKDDDILSPFMEYLKPTCINLKPGEILIVFRTQDSVPVDDYGQAPRPRRKFGDSALGRKLSKEEVEALTPKQREKILGEWGLSCNDSEDAALQSYIYTYDRLVRRGASPEDLEAYSHDRGTIICRYVITSETGLITPFVNGHANLYLYEGSDLEDYRDKDFYHTINYPSDED